LCFTHIPTYHCSRYAQTTSRNAYAISRYSVPASAGPLLPLPTRILFTPPLVNRAADLKDKLALCSLFSMFGVLSQGVRGGWNRGVWGVERQFFPGSLSFVMISSTLQINLFPAGKHVKINHRRDQRESGSENATGRHGGLIRCMRK